MAERPRGGLSTASPSGSAGSPGRGVSARKALVDQRVEASRARIFCSVAAFG